MPMYGYMYVQYIHVHVYSSCSAQTGQHEPCKGKCCSCLGTATNLLDIYVINHRKVYVVIQTAYKPLTNHSMQHRCLVISNKYMYIVLIHVYAMLNNENCAGL